MKTAFGILKAQLISVLAIFMAFVAPIKGLLIAVGFAIVLDTVFGLIKAKKLNGWKSVSSRKLSQIVSKMVLYQSAVILFYFIDLFIMGDFIKIFSGIPFFLTKLIGALLCFIELKSIDENVKIITGSSLWDRFKEMLSRGKEIKSELSEATEEKKDENAG
jgi:hypothetical protein